MNLGLGRACGDGLKAALLLGADVIVDVDADRQYDPAQIMKLVDPVQKDRADIVLGDRRMNGLPHMDWPRKLGNRPAPWSTRQLMAFRSLTVRQASAR